MRYGRLVGVLLLGMCGVTLAQSEGQLDVDGNVMWDVGHTLPSFHLDSPYNCFVKCRCWYFGLPQGDCPVEHNFVRWLEPATELHNYKLLKESCAAVLAGAEAARRAKILETVHRQMHGATKEEILIKKVFPPHNKQKRLEVAVHKSQQCVHKLYNNKMDGRKNYARRGNAVQQPPRKGAKHSYCA